MSSHIPATMRALVAQENKTALVKEVPVAQLGDNEILVKVNTVALNPTDWKHLHYLTTPGVILGSDFAGTVVKLGANQNNNLAIGDTVAGCLRGGVRPDRGAFAEYNKTFGDLVWKIPEGTMSLEEASTTGIGLYTAIQAFYDSERLALAEPYDANPNLGGWIFIYGGSTSVGQYAIQLAKLSGYKVATVASPRNHELVKSLGADVFFDYKDPEVVAKLKEATGDSISIALDTISENGSTVLTVKALSSAKPGKVITLLPPDAESLVIRKDVTVQATLIYTALGLTDTIGGTPAPSPASERANVANFLQNKVPKLVSEGKLKANVVKLQDGGLDEIPEGLKYLMDGKASAEKLVYHI